MQGDIADWALLGPRSAMHVLQRRADGSQTPVQRHYWWMSALGLGAEAGGVNEHFFLYQLIGADLSEISSRFPTRGARAHLASPS